ncbi:MAG: alpha/beta hydrolase family protein [Asticcacaulis sp.]|uniref:alpha/beta hydrolase family protein n=1 Tax=Asticcacaulis sp. TaxID=1872648 RepID=UPI003F7C702D
MLKFHAAAAALCLLSVSAAHAQNANDKTTQVIVKGFRHKLPPEAAPPPLDVFTKAPRVENIGLSPDGDRFAFVTRKGGLRLLTTYTVADGKSQTLRLSEDPISAITWLDKDHILLSATQTGLRGTCPSGGGQNFKSAQSLSDLNAAMNISGFDGSAPGMPSAPDSITMMLLENALTPPACASYGVRGQMAGTVINLRTLRSVTLGDKLAGDYNHMPLGLPKAVTVDGKTQLVGPFLELRDRSIGGQVAQRVYLWKVDADTGRGHIIDDHGGDLDRLGAYVDDWLTDADGQPVARALYTYLNEEYTIEARKDGKWVAILKRKIDDKTHTYAPFLAGLGRDGQSLLILDADNSANADAHGLRRFRYYELGLDGKLSEPLDEDATRDTPIFDPATNALAGFAHDGEVTTYSFFDPDLAAIYQHALDAAPGQAVRVVATGRDPRQMIMFEQGGEDAGSWRYFDFASGKRVDIGNQYPDIPAEWVASQRAISFTAADGLEIDAQLTLPPQGEAKHRALVVLPHDGPLGHDGRGFDWLAQALASRGYVVLQPNYRGSDGYGEALTEAGFGQWSGRMLSDIGDGVRFLTQAGIVDANRVCILGRGYGGYAALKGAQDDKGLYRCAIAIDGISDPGAYLQGATHAALADDTAPLKADPDQDRSFLADPRSPALIKAYFGGSSSGGQAPAAVTAAAAPTLLLRGDKDYGVFAAGRAGLRAQSGVQTLTLSDCGHDLATEACRLKTAQAVVDFLSANNPAR